MPVNATSSTSTSTFNIPVTSTLMAFPPVQPLIASRYLSS
jgi:hypothetical protein